MGDQMLLQDHRAIVLSWLDSTLDFQRALAHTVRTRAEMNRWMAGVWVSQYVLRRMLRDEIDVWSRNKKCTEDKKEEKKDHFILTGKSLMPPWGEGSTFTIMPMAQPQIPADMPLLLFTAIGICLFVAGFAYFPYGFLITEDLGLVQQDGVLITRTKGSSRTKRTALTCYWALPRPYLLSGFW